MHWSLRLPVQLTQEEKHLLQRRRSPQNPLGHSDTHVLLDRHGPKHTEDRRCHSLHEWEAGERFSPTIMWKPWSMTLFVFCEINSKHQMIVCICNMCEPYALRQQYTQILYSELLVSRLYSMLRDHANLVLFLNLRKKCKHVTHCCGLGPSQPSSLHSGSQGPGRANAKSQLRQGDNRKLFRFLILVPYLHEIMP